MCTPVTLNGTPEDDPLARIPAGTRRESVWWYVPANAIDEPLIVDVEGEVFTYFANEQSWFFRSEDSPFAHLPSVERLHLRHPGLIRMEVSFFFDPKEIRDQWPVWKHVVLTRIADGPRRPDQGNQSS